MRDIYGRSAARRFRDWAVARPLENWLFFAAGLVLGAILG